MTANAILSSDFNVDKNIAFNIRELRREEDFQTEQIIKCLLIYFNLSYQEDLFGYRTLDPHIFAKTMNLSVANLFRTHPSPEFCKSKHYNPDELHLWDSYLANALYILYTQPIFSEYRGITNEYSYVGLKNFLIIKEIQLYIKRIETNKAKKFFYKYKLDETFESNINRYFIQTNVNLFIECKKKNIEDFYLHITNLYNAYKFDKDSFYFTFDELCSFFYISSDLQPKNRKGKVNKYFRLAEEILKDTIPGLKFDWVKTTGKWKYTPVMMWNKLDKEVLKIETNKIFANTLYKLIRRNLHDTYLSQYDGFPDDESFLHWMKHPASDYIKESTIVTSYTKIYKISANHLSSVRIFCRELLTELKKASSLEEFDKICSWNVLKRMGVNPDL